MPFVKGKSGNPGGQPGAMKQIKYDVKQILRDKSCCPFIVLADLMMTSEDDGIRCRAAEALAPYLAPKLKQVEYKNDSENPFTFTLNIGNQKMVNGVTIDNAKQVTHEN